MNKKISIIAPLITLFFIMIVIGNASAGLEPLLGPYMTDSAGSTVQKDIFDWNEEPYVFIQFDREDLNPNAPLTIWWAWYYEDEPFMTFEWESITGFQEDPVNIWNSLDNWDNYKKQGEWSVYVGWQNTGSGWGTDKTTFTVTPEPISSILFLTGGATLAARHYWKKRNKEKRL